MKKRKTLIIILLVLLALFIGALTGYISFTLRHSASEQTEESLSEGTEIYIEPGESETAKGGEEESEKEAVAETGESEEGPEESMEETEESEEETAESVEETEESAEETAESVEETEESAEETAESMEETEESAEETAEEAESVESTAGPSTYSAGQAVSYDAVTEYGVSAFFTQSSISDDVFSRIYGKSFGTDCTTSRDSLRYLRVLYYDFNDQCRVGELICNRAISDDLLEIFRELYNNHYPISKMRLVDDYDADDEWSASENNTSCFNYRNVAGSNSLSRHATGMAIDINPMENPYVKFDGAGNVTYCSPANGIDYVDRSRSFSHKIDSSDLCTQLFLAHGFTWGGSWNSPDYMHFEMR